MWLKLFLLSVLSVLFFFAQTAQKSSTKKTSPNELPIVEEFESTVRVIDLCPFSPTGACNSAQAHLEVIARDPDGDEMTYKYSVSSGEIVGKGRFVSWNLKNAKYGKQTAAVTVEDGRGGKTTASLEVTVTECGTCDPPPPPCPTIQLVCPERIKNAELIVCSVSLSGDPGAITRPSFDWSVSWGKIIKGQNTREIEIAPTDSDEDVQVTIAVGGADPACSTTISRTIRINKTKQRI